jgi:hypothetical protein
VTRDGDLIHNDNETVNLVKDKPCSKWAFLSVCCTASDKILVTMITKSREQSKVSRYSDYKETQTIQFDDEGRRLYSSDSTDRFICENRNLDVCVADNKALDENIKKLKVI